MKPMQQALRLIKRYCKVYGIFMKNCLIRQMEYRANFFLVLFLESCFLGTKLVYTFVINNTQIRLNELPADSIFMFTGSFLLMTGIYMACFFFNFTRIQEYVGDGSLDLFITKPISLQFITTLRNVDFSSMIPNLIGGVIILVIGWKKAGAAVNFVNIAGYVGYLLSGVLVVYAVMLAPQLLCFIIVKGYALTQIGDAIWDSNGMPMTIYNKPLQFLGTYIFPLFVFSNFASLFVLGYLNTRMMLWGALAPFIFLFLIRLLWKWTIRFYSSASS